jgi:hypothetical protein
MTESVPAIPINAERVEPSEETCFMSRAYGTCGRAASVGLRTLYNPLTVGRSGAGARRAPFATGSTAESGATMAAAAR